VKRVATRRVVVLCPHFAPDTAPTGVVMTRIVAELTGRGYEVHVVTALPWYRHHRIETGWGGRLMRTERTPWGSIRRVHPFPGHDKANLVRRAVGFLGFSVLALVAGVRAAGWGRRCDAVIAMSPPLTLGLTGWLVGLSHRCGVIFNVQDVFPDAAERSGAVTNRRILTLARWLERITYRSARAVTVLSSDLADNVAAKMPPRHRQRVRTIPNFVDTDAIVPGDRLTSYRRELGIGDEPVVMYAGNVGFSQPFELMIEAARRLPQVTFVINGDGAAAHVIDDAAASLPNLWRVGYQPADRLSEVLASADLHVVILKAGLGAVSVPSKTYSVLAAGRPVLASIDPQTEIPRLLQRADAGVSVPPDDVEAFIEAIADLVAEPPRCQAMGERGRALVIAEASPAAVGAAYEQLITEVQAIASPTRG
jgi:colanic acid biosynthesis glycosyl transferase WcaI